MNNRGLAVAAFFAILAMAGMSQATGERKNRLVDPSYRHEGDTRDFFGVTCSSHTAAWTVLVASDSVRRSVKFMSLPTNSGGVCISSATTTESFSDTTAGWELYPSSASALTDYTVAAWSCRSRAGNADDIKGYATRHSKDLRFAED